MVAIQLDAAGKKFERRWIFRGVTISVSQGESLVITGYNGSGKSTLLQLFSGFMNPSEGSVSFTNNGKLVAADDWHTFITCVTPVLELPDDLTFRENIDFFRSFKGFAQDFSEETIADLTQLKGQLDRPVRHFSSGMKQRVKLGLAFLSSAPVVLLDEPVANLDQPGTEWFSEMAARYCNDKLLIICSNRQPVEMALCNRHFDLSEHIASTN